MFQFIPWIVTWILCLGAEAEKSCLPNMMCCYVFISFAFTATHTFFCFFHFLFLSLFLSLFHQSPAKLLAMFKQIHFSWINTIQSWKPTIRGPKPRNFRWNKQKELNFLPFTFIVHTKLFSFLFSFFFFADVLLFSSVHSSCPVREPMLRHCRQLKNNTSTSVMFQRKMETFASIICSHSVTFFFSLCFSFSFFHIHMPRLAHELLTPSSNEEWNDTKTKFLCIEYGTEHWNFFQSELKANSSVES